jgi:hypothetical protein
LGFCQTAENLIFWFRFKTLIVLTLRYQPAAFRGWRGFCDLLRKISMAMASLPESRRRLYRELGLAFRPEEAG